MVKLEAVPLELDKLFELIYFIDKAGLMIKDRESDAYKLMRKKHYENCRWLVDHRSEKAYYDYFFDHNFRDKEEDKQ